MRAPLLTSLAAGVLAVHATAQSPWQVGQPLPHVHLPTIDGDQEVDLSVFRGKKLLLLEFASW